MRAWKDLTTQCDFGPRKPGTDAQKACRDYIAAELKKTCENVHFQPFRHTWSRTGETLQMWNVIGEQNWKNSTIHVALFAHWDSRPSADNDPDPSKRLQAITGADDGASGVAVLLELARILKVEPAKVGVMYVMIDGEDLGPDSNEMYLGSIVFGDNQPTPKPDYGILLDMIGNKGVVVPQEYNSQNFAPKLEKALYLYATKIGLGATFPFTTGDNIEDDHWALNKAGIPTIDLIDFNYPSWHTLADTPDKCSPDSLDKIGTLLASWLRQATPFDMKGE